MIRRLVFIVVILTLFATFAYTAFQYEDEKSNAYYMKDGEDYALIAINTNERYIYGVKLEDNLTLSNGTNYTSFENIKSDPTVAIEYLQYTFSIKEIRYLDKANPEYGSKFADYLVSQTEGSLEEFSASLNDLPHSYESGYNVQYLRLADLAHYNSDGYMDKEILTSIVNGEDDGDVNTETIPITEDMIEKVFYDIETIEIICDENNICVYEEDAINNMSKKMTKLINDNISYITNYEGQTQK